jgi:hypothetical protein
MQAMMDDGGQVTFGALNGIRAAALATMPACVLATLRGRANDSWFDLLLRLNANYGCHAISFSLDTALKKNASG